MLIGTNNWDVETYRNKLESNISHFQPMLKRLLFCHIISLKVHIFSEYMNFIMKKILIIFGPN